VHDLTLETAPHTEVRAGLTASVASVAWTAITSAIAIGFGVSSGSVVLIAFGAVGFFDLAGSSALVVHFRHALRHQEISGGHERIAHLVVSYGMLTVGVATLAGSIDKLASDSESSEPLAGLIASAASIFVLGYLGVRKRAIGRQIPSRALTTDGALSLTGAGTAACTVAGLGLNDAFGWTWVDPVAAMCIGVTACVIAVVSLRSE
jgi:divalent metal cation (Fe/Co/Zn/Cd) transporter